MGHGTFATVIDCIDGRTKLAVIAWMKSAAQVDFVDMVTEPGPEMVLTQGTPEDIAALKRKMMVSVNAHHSTCVAVVAHAECAGNPVSDERHMQQVRQSVEQIVAWGLPIRVIGLWVNHAWSIELVCETQANHAITVG